MMKRWARRVRGAVGMGVTWATVWLAVGLLIGVFSVLSPALPWDAIFDVFDAPLPALAIPGFVGGALFSVVLGIAGRRRRFEQLSLPSLAAWGALGGLLLALVPTVMVAAGLATLGPQFDGSLQLTAVIAGPLTLLSAASASATLLVARRATKRSLPDGDRTWPASRPPQ
ncbi:MAG: hypothetical protein ABI910_20595 [Gemmatimonadota bacterium]